MQTCSGNQDPQWSRRGTRPEATLTSLWDVDLVNGGPRGQCDHYKKGSWRVRFPHLSPSHPSWTLRLLNHPRHTLSTTDNETFKMSCCDPSSDMSAKVTETPATKNSVGPGYAVQGSEELRYSYSFVDDIFDTNKEDLASHYQKWGRVLCVLDDTVHQIYGSAIQTCKLLSGYCSVIVGTHAHYCPLWNCLCFPLTSRY